MIIRENYLRQIRPFYENEQIKILMGVRRSGKTEILKMIMNEISQKTSSNHIIYLSFELFENKKYRNDEALYEFLDSKFIENDESKYFFFLDEIQFAQNWPEVINSIKTKHRNSSIFLTGSNSKLLNDDKDCVLGGRTILFKIMPFNFIEFLDFHSQRDNIEHFSRENLEKLFSEYMNWGGFPLIFSEKEDSQKELMLESIFDSIVLRDIVNRKGIKNSIYLEKIIDYVLASSSLYISGRSISSKIEKDGMSISLPTILDYLKAIEESCITSLVPRFDVIGLKTIEFNDKTYACDTSFINYKKSLISDLYGTLFETIVYNDLISKGFSVKIGSANGLEIDFVATRGMNTRIYVQVCYEITERNREREFGNFAPIKDNYPKYVVSKDTVSLSVNGIIHINIIDFLMKEW